MTKNVNNLKNAMLDGNFDEGTITVSSGIEFIIDYISENSE